MVVPTEVAVRLEPMATMVEPAEHVGDAGGAGEDEAMQAEPAETRAMQAELAEPTVAMAETAEHIGDAGGDGRDEGDAGRAG